MGICDCDCIVKCNLSRKRGVMHIGTEQIHGSQHKYLIPRKPLEKVLGHKIINGETTVQTR